MGWLYNFSMTTRKAIIADRTKGYNSKERSIKDGNEQYFVTKCLKSCYRGGVGSGTLWKVMETKVYDVETDFLIKTDLWIGCDLLQWCNRDKCWGYKDLEESMGPHKVNCPISYLDIVPEPDHEFARNWREAVRAYHKDRTPDFKPKEGTYVILREGWSRRGPFKLTSISPLLGTTGADCYATRIPRRALLREVTREELDRAKKEREARLKRISLDENFVHDINDDAIFYENEFLFASVEKK